MSVCEMQAALAKADTGLQRAHFDSVEAQWERDSMLAATKPVANVKAIPRPKPPAGPHPKAPVYKTPVGIGGAYCALLAGVGRLAGGGPRSAAAATARPLPPSAGISPSAGGMAGLPPDQRINLAKLNADQSRLLRNRYDVEIQKKFSLAAACLIFVLVGAPVALRFPRGGVGLVIGVSLFIFAVYYVGLIGGEALSDRGIISPFWAMWATNVIMTAVGLFMTLRMGREATTGRGGDFGEMLEAARMWFARAGRKIGLPLERRRRMA
jgi:lipopolysaccharide export system permease protein